MKVTLPDGSVKEFPSPVSAAQVAASIGAGLAKAAIGAKVNGELYDLNRTLPGDCALSIITKPRFEKDGRTKGAHNPDALYLLRHSCAHVMAEAIERVYGEGKVKLAYGPPLENGFYYDMALDTPISTDDFPKIEAEMQKIVAENRPFTRVVFDKDEGFAILDPARGPLKKYRDEIPINKYKIDNARRATEAGADTLTWYFTGRPRTMTREGTADSVVDVFHRYVSTDSVTGNVIDMRTAPRIDVPGGIFNVSNPDPWSDLCMGPHVPSTGEIVAFKITSVASSNWKGDVSLDRFQRVYGTAFFSKADLDHHLAMQDEAKKRDHRVLGKQLRLFHIDDAVGQGLVLWTPRGAVIRQVLQNFIGAELQKQGYTQVFTPHIGKRELYITSGHYPYYEASQFPQMRQIDDRSRELLIYLREVRDEKIKPDPKLEKELVEKAGLGDSKICCSDDIDTKLALGRYLAQTGENYVLKPMNCPHHIKIFASEKRSYRDMPVRLAEFGTVYRWEKSGEIGGMTRVRGFTQDDAHLFVREDQLADEVQGCLSLVKIIFKTLGITEYRVRVGLRDPDSAKYVGTPENWDKAEAACKAAAASLGVPFSTEPGEAAFYGPKIDFVVKDVIGREWQLGTVQVDYNLPIRFDLNYTGSDNKQHRPVMIHRAPFGSMERFVGVLIEHFAGAFPLWLSPEQMRVLPVSDKFLPYAKIVFAKLKDAGFRVTLDDSGDRLNGMVKVAQDDKVNYMLVVGGKDEAAPGGGTVSVRDRSRGDIGAITLQGPGGFIEKANAELATYGQTQISAG